MAPLLLPPHLLLRTMFVAALVFMLLAVAYAVGSPVSRVDVSLGTLLHEINDLDIGWITASMSTVSFFGGNGLLLIVAIATGYFAMRHAWPEVLLVIVTVGGVIVCNRLLKEYFEVLRPMVGHTDRFEESTGFPSGHAMIAMATYGLLAALAAAQLTVRSKRLIIWGVAGGLIFLIGVSRLYLSVHYLSDVIGGYAAGLAWGSLCLWLYDRFWVWRLKNRRGTGTVHDHSIHNRE